MLSIVSVISIVNVKPSHVWNPSQVWLPLLPLKCDNRICFAAIHLVLLYLYIVLNKLFYLKLCCHVRRLVLYCLCAKLCNSSHLHSTTWASLSKCVSNDVAWGNICCSKMVREIKVANPMKVPLMCALYSSLTRAGGEAPAEVRQDSFQETTLKYASKPQLQLSPSNRGSYHLFHRYCRFRVVLWCQ